MKPIKWPIRQMTKMWNAPSGNRKDQAEIQVWYALYEEYRHTWFESLDFLILFDMKQYSSKSCCPDATVVTYGQTLKNKISCKRIDNRIWITLEPKSGNKCLCPRII